jgi:CHAT domain-containing protein
MRRCARTFAQLKQARKTLRQEIERRFPAYAQLVNPKPVGIAEAQSKLRDGDVLLVTYFNNGAGRVWAAPKHGAPAFEPIGLSESEIVSLVADVLAPVTSNASSIGDVPAFDIEKSHKLYNAVLRPVAAAIKDAKNIIVIADGPLGRLPFSLLVTSSAAQPQEAADKPAFAGYREVPFLIRSAAVTHLPSVSAFMSLRSMPPGSGTPQAVHRFRRSLVQRRAGEAGGAQR